MIDPFSPVNISHSATALFLTGFFGGIHCAGMCGGIVTALGMRSSTQPSQLAQTKPLVFVQNDVVTTELSRSDVGFVSGIQHSLVSDKCKITLLYNAGRIGTYLLLGALAGAIGAVGWWIQHALPVQQMLFLLTNFLLLMMGLYVYGVRSVGVFVEKTGGMLWQFIQPLAVRQIQHHGATATVFTGALWGLVPCGMVYGALLAALFSGSAVNGALLMLAFGLGTLPNMLLLGVSTQWLAGLQSNTSVRRYAGVVIMLFAVFGVLRAGAASDIPLLQWLCLSSI